MSKSFLKISGKGVTFDTGGISIKPASKMEDMRADMGGAANVVGALQIVASLGLPLVSTESIQVLGILLPETSENWSDLYSSILVYHFCKLRRLIIKIL